MSIFSYHKRNHHCGKPNCYSSGTEWCPDAIRTKSYDNTDVRRLPLKENTQGYMYYQPNNITFGKPLKPRMFFERLWRLWEIKFAPLVVEICNSGCQPYLSYTIRSFSKDPIGSGSSPPTNLTTKLSKIMEIDVYMKMEMEIKMMMEMDMDIEIKFFFFLILWRLKQWHSF